MEDLRPSSRVSFSIVNRLSPCLTFYRVYLLGLLQANKQLSQFLEWFSVMDSLNREYTDATNIVCQSCFKLLVKTKRWERRTDEHTDSVAELFGSFAGWVNSELVGSMRNTEWMILISIHNVKMPS